MKIHVVRWPTPLGPSISPYINRLPAVQRLSYARLQTALDLARTSPAERILDFGCWAGHFLPSLLKHFPEVWGVDDDSASLVEMLLPDVWTILLEARKLCDMELGSSSRLGLAKATGAALPFSDGYFDLVFCLDTLAHISPSRRRRVVDELRRTTRPGGQVIFSLPIEIGPTFWLKHAMRVLTARQSDPTTKGYDFRADLELLHSSFAICETQFFPVNPLGSLNAAVFVNCRTDAGRFEGSSKE